MKKLKKNKKDRNKEIALLTYIFTGLFLLLMGRFVYFNVIESEEVINNTYNKRQQLFAKTVTRGDILASDGEVLAETITTEDGKEVRNYPYGTVFSHVVGYDTNGKLGIESLANFSLLRSNIFWVEKVANEIAGNKSPGDSVYTTLKVSLQKTAYDALGDNRGAVIAMDPDTGKIFAMVSKPDFDPNEINEIWDDLTNPENESDSVLLNRVTQGQYPPGSTFKIITALAYIKEHQDYENFSYTCKGSITLDDSTINCYHNNRHGEVSLETAFAKSCNTAFSQIGVDLDKTAWAKLCSDFLFNQELPLSFPYKSSSFKPPEESNTAQWMQTAIGQGETLVSPIHMAMITGAIANEGLLMKPYVIDYVKSAEDKKITQYEPEEYGNLLIKDDAAILQQFMKSVVQEGTGTKLKSDKYEAAGKTGSAEYSNEKGKSHAWFTGYAQKDDKKLVVTVIVEGGGSGSEAAVPIAKKIFDTYYE